MFHAGANVSSPSLDLGSSDFQAEAERLWLGTSTACPEPELGGALLGLLWVEGSA